MTSSKFLSFIVLLTFVFSGCMQSERPNDSQTVKAANIFEEENNAGFLVDRFRAEGMIDETVPKTEAGVPLTAKYIFVACMKGSARRERIPEFPFAVYSYDRGFKEQILPNGESDGRLDENGCLQWQEQIPFDHSLNPRNVFTERVLVGLGSRRGTRRLIFSINPWAAAGIGNDPEWVDYTFDQSMRNKKLTYFSQLELPTKGAVVTPFDFLTTDVTKGKEARSRLVIRKDPIFHFDRSVIKGFNIVPRDLEEKDPVGGLETNYVMLPGSESGLDRSYILSQAEKYNIPMIDNEGEPLVFDKSRVQPYGGVVFDMALAFQIERRYKSSDDLYDYKPINQGRFAAVVALYAHDVEGPNTHTRISEFVLANSDEKENTFSVSDEGLLEVKFKTLVPYYSTTGDVVLAVRLIPLNQGDYEPVESLFRIGDYNRLLKKEGSLKKDPSIYNTKFSFQDYVKAATGNSTAIRNGNLQVLKPFQYSMMNFKFLTVEAGETATRRTVLYRTETCVSDFEAGGRVMEGAQFEVFSLRYPIDYKGDGDYSNDVEGVDYERVPLYSETQGDEIKADVNGCIRFIDKMTHKYYQIERLIDRRIEIRRKDDPGDKGQFLTAYMNPWDEKYGTLGTDSRSVTKSFIDGLRNRNKIPTRFFIKDFGYETLRFRYQIDKNMKLQVKKTVLFRTRPLVLRYSNILQGINSIHDLRDGIYLLKLAYQKDYLDPAAEIQTGHDPNNIPIIGVGPSYKFDQEKCVESGGYDCDMKLEAGRPQMTLYKPPGDPETNSPVDTLDVITDDINHAYHHSSPYSTKARPHLIERDPRKKQHLSVIKKLVRVNAGNIITPIEFHVDDLRLLRIRGQLFVQIEPINQVKLQIVNIVSEEIEKRLELKLGEKSCTSELDEELQRELQDKKRKALDALALSIPDNISVRTVEDLSVIFENKAVVDAFSEFSDIGELSSLERIFGTVYGKSPNLTWDEIQERILNRPTESDLRAREDQAISMQKAANEKVNLANREALGPYISFAQDDRYLMYRYSSVFNKYCAKKDGFNYDRCVQEVREDNLDIAICRCFSPQGIEASPVGDAVANQGMDEFREKLTRILDGESLKRSAVQDFFKSVSTEDTISKILMNDFTLAAASADLSDLDFLLDEYKEEDIKPRTFVGPFTFIRASNGGALRPTDNLDEGYCITDDCNMINPLNRYGEIKNFAYDRSKYHGSIAHFAHVQVDDFIKGSVEKGIPSYNEFLDQKKKKEEFDSLLYNFVQAFNMKYLSITGGTPLRKPVCNDVNKVTGECLEEEHEFNVSLDDFLNNFRLPMVIGLKRSSSENGRWNRTVEYNKEKKGFRCKSDVEETCPLASKDNLLKLVKKAYPDPEGQPRLKGVVPVSYASFTRQDYRFMCQVMVGHIAVPAAGKRFNPDDYSNMFSRGFARDALGSDMEDLYNDCMRYGPELLNVERKYHIFETGRYYYLGGKSLNINLGQSIGISSSRSASTSYGINVADALMGIPKAVIGNKAGVLGDPKMGRNLNRLGVALQGLNSALSSFSYKYGRSDSFSASAGTSINQGTFLVMQNAEFDVELTSYEQCLSIRWSDVAVERNKDLFFGSDFDDLSLDQRYERAMETNDIRKGLMLCSGERETKPLAVRETYYYFTQHFVEGDMQDRNDIHNHPWLLSLRGVREYETFLLATHSEHDQGQEDGKRYVRAFDLVNFRDQYRRDMDYVRGAIHGDTLKDTGYKKFDRVHIYNWPLRQLIKTYQKISPTFPGLYTQLGREEYTTDQWPWTGSRPGDRFNKSSEEYGDELQCPKH